MHCHDILEYLESFLPTALTGFGWSSAKDHDCFKEQFVKKESPLEMISDSFSVNGNWGCAQCLVTCFMTMGEAQERFRVKAPVPSAIENDVKQTSDGERPR
jgi:hypothetical protein